MAYRMGGIFGHRFWELRREQDRRPHVLSSGNLLGGYEHFFRSGFFCEPQLNSFNLFCFHGIVGVSLLIATMELVVAFCASFFCSFLHHFTLTFLVFTIWEKSSFFVCAWCHRKLTTTLSFFFPGKKPTPPLVDHPKVLGLIRFGLLFLGPNIDDHPKNGNDKNLAFRIFFSRPFFNIYLELQTTIVE